MNSSISEIPGPDVDVNARAPAQFAPITMPADASSSSAWMMQNFFSFVTGSTRYRSQSFVNASINEVAGVIGYQAPTVAPAYSAPSAEAVLPSIRTYSAFAFIRSRWMGSGHAKFALA